MTASALTTASPGTAALLAAHLRHWRSASEIERRSDERELLERYHRAGDAAAREALVHRFLPLAHQLARRYQGGREPIDDLMQVASLGLLKAIDRFDPARQTALSSFAVPTIVGELKRHHRDHGWAVHVPRGLQERSALEQRTTEALWCELGRPPTPAEVAARANATVGEILEARRASAARKPMSLDGSPSGSPDPLQGVLAVEEPGYRQAEQRATIATLLRVLDEQEREILRLRFGDELSQREIGDRVGLSQVQVSRLIRRALTRLQAAAEGRAHRPPAPSANSEDG